MSIDTTQQAPKTTHTGIGSFKLPPIPRRGEGEVYDPMDPDVMRKRIYNRFTQGLQSRFPMDNEKHVLMLEDVRVDDRTYGPAEQREAIVNGGDLSVRVKGRWRLMDKETGQEIDKTNLKTIANIPWLTERGTFIRSGRDEIIPMQMRMAHGAFTRRLNNGGASTRVNSRPGTGFPFEVSVDPKTGVFSMKKGTRNFKMYPILHSLGVSDDDMQRVWGKSIYTANKAASGDNHLRAIQSGLLRTKNIIERLPEEEPNEAEVYTEEVETFSKEAFELSKDENQELIELFSNMQLDPDSTRLSMGREQSRVSPSFLLDVTNKTLDVARGRVDSDVRDNLAHQRIYDVADMLAERATMDSGKIARTMLWKVTNKNSLEKVPSGALNKWVDQFFKKSRLAQAPDESNLLEAHMRRSMVTRMGEGGMGDPMNAPMSTRLVDPSFQGFLDPVVTPEKMRTGLDSYLASGVRKGDDGLLRSRFIDRFSGEEKWLDPITMSESIVALPDTKPIGGKIPAFKNGKLMYANPKEVRYELPNMDSAFSPWGNLIPVKNHTKPGRLLVAAKHATQALSLVDREAPFVRTTDPLTGKGSVEANLGALLGAPRAQKPGSVSKVGNGWIEIQHTDGTSSRTPIHEFLPMNRHSVLQMSPKVNPGDKVKKGQILATSSFTDKEGNAALGRNLRMAYTSYKGLNHKDAYVISETAAKKLSHQSMIREDVDADKHTKRGRESFISMFPGQYNKEQIKGIGEDGVAKKGTVVHKGDPLILAYRDIPPGPTTFGRRIHKDASVTWDKPYAGVVADAGVGKKRASIYVRANVPMEEGDKLTGRYQNKGVVSIVPDSEMFTDAEGKPYDIIMNPAGIPSRVNTGQIWEALLGKVAEKTGKHYDLPGFLSGGKVRDLVKEELSKNNISDTEDIIDPSTGRKIPGVLTGNMFMYKLSQLSDLKAKARGTGVYTQEEMPLAGGEEGGRRVGGLVLGAFLGHGANEMVKDLKLVQGRRNDDFWRTYKTGGTPSTPAAPMVYKKFLEHLKGAGITVREEVDHTNIFAMTGEEAKNVSKKDVTSMETYDAKRFTPIKGGLFDPAIFGDKGNQWGRIPLPEPILNPVMEDPVKHLLGITGKKFETLLDAPGELKDKLKSINLDSEIRRAYSDIKSGPPSKKDASIKRLRAARSMKENEVRPEDFLMDYIPILPPAYRPISIEDKDIIAADANYLYRDMIASAEDLKDAKEAGLPEDSLTDARGTMRRAFRVVTGLSDPDGARTESKELGGLLKWALGKGSPKHSAFQRKVVGGVVDHSGLAVITPNPSLNMDEVGLPEKTAWGMYSSHVMRRLVRGGMSATEASKRVERQDDSAREALQEEMKGRPVVMSRAPALHKFNVLAMRPKLIKSKTLQVPPAVLQPLNADFDGNCCDFDEEITLLLSKSALDKYPELWYINNNPQQKEADMLESKSSCFIRVGEESLYPVRIKIGNFPKVGTPFKDKNGADVYELPDGVYIESYDPEKGGAKLYPVTKYTVDKGHVCCEVQYKNSMSVIVSNNESLCVFDRELGTISKKKPEESLGLFSPVLRKSPYPFGDFGNFDLGWWIGMFISDGWVGNKVVGIAKSEDKKREEFIRIAREQITVNFESREHTGSKSDTGKLGDSVKVHLYSKELADIVVKWGLKPEEGEGRSALRKEIPYWMITRGSEYFLFGLLSGLLDGDGSIVCNKALKNPRFACRFSTSSIKLVESCKALAYRLGLRCNHTTTPPKGLSNEAYNVFWSTLDVFEVLDKIKVVGKKENEIISVWKKNPPLKDNDRDSIPVSIEERALFTQAGVPNALCSSCTASKPYAGRRPLIRFFDSLVEQGIENHLLKDLEIRARDNDVMWSQVKEVTDAGTRDVFDFEVDGPKIFATGNGLIIWDTALMYVPTGRKAVEEAWEKVTPSKNLLSARFFSTKGHFVPEEEFILGSYLATRKGAGAPIVFQSKEEALKAYREGSIKSDTPITIVNK